MSEYKVYAVIGVVVSSILLWQYVTIERLEAELTSTRADLAVKESSIVGLKAKIEKQNDEVDRLAIDLQNRTDAYTKLLDQPEKVRYRVVYETVESIGVKSDECEDIKKLIDDIRSAGY